MPRKKDGIIGIIGGIVLILIAVLLIIATSPITPLIELAYRESVITYRSDCAIILMGSFMLFMYGAVFLQTVCGLLSIHAGIRYNTINVKNIEHLLGGYVFGLVLMSTGAMLTLAEPYLASIFDFGYKYAGFSGVWNWVGFATVSLFLIGLFGTVLTLAATWDDSRHETRSMKDVIGAFAVFIFILVFVIGHRYGEPSFYLSGSVIAVLMLFFVSCVLLRFR